MARSNHNDNTPPGWGKINKNAFRTQLTLDLDRAFSLMRSNIPERAILQYVREHSWSEAIKSRMKASDPFPDPIPCVINLSELARLTGCDRGNLSRARTALVDDRILLEVDGGVIPNKNADQWASDRINPECLEYARSAQVIENSFKPRVRGVVDQPQGGVVDQPQGGVVDQPQSAPQNCGRSATPKGGGVVDQPQVQMSTVVDQPQGQLSGVVDQPQGGVVDQPQGVWSISHTPGAEELNPNSIPSPLPVNLYGRDPRIGPGGLPWSDRFYRMIQGVELIFPRPNPEESNNGRG